MNREHAKRWLEYYERGQKPTRVKLKAVVYSDKTIKKPVHFKLNNFEMTLSPLPLGQQPRSPSEGGLMPAFVCETIADLVHHRDGNNFDLYECLDRVLPVAGFKYHLSIHFNQWEEYDNDWIETVSGGGRISMMCSYEEIPKPNIQALVQAYEKLSLKSDKRSRKAVMLRTRLKEALELEEASPRYSFMSYYSIIEIISDDLAAHKDVPSSNRVAVDMARHSLSTKGSQRTKIYFLLLAFENDFDLDQKMALPDKRNDLAHGQFELESHYVDACKELAVWASEKYVLHLACEES
ncbi:hypothetical protein [Stenotrophomonas sp. AR026]|uniref:hypothetical protein n=1 Tax=Stenotrophomonas sp. AR026 TaxID=3398462 RepID=UPI003BB16415